MHRRDSVQFVWRYLRGILRTEIGPPLEFIFGHAQWFFVRKQRIQFVFALVAPAIFARDKLHRFFNTRGLRDFFDGVAQPLRFAPCRFSIVCIRHILIVFFL